METKHTFRSVPHSVPFSPHCPPRQFYTQMCNYQSRSLPDSVLTPDCPHEVQASFQVFHHSILGNPKGHIPQNILLLFPSRFLVNGLIVHLGARAESWGTPTDPHQSPHPRHSLLPVLPFYYPLSLFFLTFHCHFHIQAASMSHMNSNWCPHLLALAAP